MSVRRMACEALTFMCYFEQPHGQVAVVKGLEALNNINLKGNKMRKQMSRFSNWLSELERMLNGYAQNQKELSKSPGVKDGQMTEYAVSKYKVQHVDVQLIFIYIFIIEFGYLFG